MAHPAVECSNSVVLAWLIDFARVFEQIITAVRKDLQQLFFVPRPEKNVLNQRHHILFMRGNGGMAVVGYDHELSEVEDVLAFQLRSEVSGLVVKHVVEVSVDLRVGGSLTLFVQIVVGSHEVNRHQAGPGAGGASGVHLLEIVNSE